MPVPEGKPSSRNVLTSPDACGHAQRLQHALGDVLLEPLSGDPFDESPEQRETGVGILVRSSGRVREGEAARDDALELVRGDSELQVAPGIVLG